jgi:hypothetical protein
MTYNYAETALVNDTDDNSRGAIIRLFGVIFIILGTLNTMLAWRGGLEVMSFQTALFVSGVLLCMIGAIRRQIGPKNSS